jgi:hypothetical protein
MGSKLTTKLCVDLANITFDRRNVIPNFILALRPRELNLFPPSHRPSPSPKAYGPLH